MNKKKENAVARAVTFLTTQLNSYVWKDGERLPTAAQLAQSANVAYSNMLAALAIVQKQKKLIYKAHVGIFAGTALPPLMHKASKHTAPLRWHSLKVTLAKEILAGRFHMLEFLPSLKELAATYTTDPRVVKQAIHRLKQEKLLESAGRRYRIVKPTILTRSEKVVYLCINEKIRFFYHQWSFEREKISIILRDLEKECFHRNITLVRYWYSTSPVNPRFFSNAIGCIVLCTPQDGDDEAIFRLIDALRPLKKQTVVFSISSQFPSPFVQRLTSVCKRNDIFMSDFSFEKRAGNTVGQFLLHKGHKKICFFSHATSDSIMAEQWKSRYLGVEEIYTAADFQNAITLFDINNISNNPDASPMIAATRLPIKEIQEQLWDGRGILDNLGVESPFVQALKEKMDTIHNYLLDFNKNKGPFLELTFQNMSLQLMECLSNVSTLQIPLMYKSTLINTFHEIVNYVSLSSTFIPYFQKALTTSDATAWVCVEDYLANCARTNFLTEKNSNVVGIIGFQDHLESNFNGISSYRYDFSTTALKALNLILFPLHAQKTLCAKNSNVFEVDGMVIDRGSV